MIASGDSDVPAIAWFGDRLPDNSAKGDGTDLNAVTSMTDLPLPMAKLDQSVPLSLFPQRSTGIDCSPALRGHSNGTLFDHRFERSGVTQKDGGLLIELHDNAAELAVVIEVTLHVATGVLSIATTLTNNSRSSKCYTVDWLASATMPLPGSYRECLHLHGRWGLEFQTHRSAIAPGVLCLLYTSDAADE